MRQRERELRAELRMLQIRYDDDKVSAPIFAVIKQLQTEIAWLEQQDRQDVGPDVGRRGPKGGGASAAPMKLEGPRRLSTGSTL